MSERKPVDTSGWNLAEWAALDPKDWPHTPPLHIYQWLAFRNPNLPWAIDTGHLVNLLEVALDRLDLMDEETLKREGL